MDSHKTTNHNDRYVVFYEFDDEGTTRSESATAGTESEEDD
ncbi:MULTISPECIES: hypothetical protein [unclassified Halorhabdus]|nr:MULTISPECIES: hypothetical protein [unclassified Halorhabdus]